MSSAHIYPPSDAERCRAQVQTYVGRGRCRERRTEGWDLCETHADVERAGGEVRRVLPARETA